MKIPKDLNVRCVAKLDGQCFLDVTVNCKLWTVNLWP
jgi:hypothetical protein